MRPFFFALAGLLAGFLLPWLGAILLAPETGYEQVLGLMFLGAVAGGLGGAILGRRRR
jgi:LPXTG-motif cell wall-anchored protein